SGVLIQESAQTKTEHSWLCEEEGYSIKAASSVRRVIAMRGEEEVRIQVATLGPLLIILNKGLESS
uniref:Uncharacterized protein n=1 Tax=Brassica oleracea var. oleracea TaxID=109376 RepID=A0A0D3BX99_BRAOL